MHFDVIKVEKMRPTAIKIVYMGDSITEGQYISPPHRWSDIVTDRIERKYLKTPVNLIMLNKGISGQTTRQGLERYPDDVQIHAPDVMTLQFGLNDCNCWVSDAGLPRVSEAAYKANMIEMIDRAKQFGVKRIILSTNHRTLREKILLSGENLEQRRRRYNDIVREIAREREVIFVDIAKTFEKLPVADLEDMLLPYPDHLHLSAEGHKFYADTIYPVIADAIEITVNAINENEGHHVEVGN